MTEFATDVGRDPGSPRARLREVRKQLRLILDDVDDETVEEYLQRSLSTAESAHVCLVGPEVLGDHGGGR